MLQRTDGVSDHLVAEVPATASSPEDGDQRSEIAVERSMFGVRCLLP